MAHSQTELDDAEIHDRPLRSLARSPMGKIARGETTNAQCCTFTPCSRRVLGLPRTAVARG